MDDILLAVSVSFMAFLSTSIDNLFLLITLTLHPKYGSAKVRTGYLLAVLLMLGICLMFARGVQQLPLHFIPYIGLVPLTIGMYELWELVRGGKSAAIPDGETGKLRGGSFLTVTMIMITHSWDSIAVLAPLLSDTRPGLTGWMAASILIAAGALTFVAQKAVSHPSMKAFLQRYAPKVLPFLLIAVGLYILLNTSTDIT